MDSRQLLGWRRSRAVISRVGRGLLLLLGLSGLSVTRLQAQAAERVVFGIVIDSVTGQPLDGTSAYFTTSRLEAKTRRDGLFVVHGDTTRDSVLVVRRIGYVPRTVIVSPLTHLVAVDVGTVYLRPVATQLDAIAVETEEVRRYPQLDGFYTRRAHLGGLGHFMTREHVVRTAALRTSDVLRRSHKVEIECNRRGGTGDCAATSRRAREIRFFLQPIDTTYSSEELGSRFAAEAARCRMEVWVDGVRSPFNLDEIPVDWIVGIEIYSGPETTPVEFGQGACGVVAIWTAVPGY